MSKYTDVMIDLETFGTDSNAVIVVIAGIKFNRAEPTKPLGNMETFYVRIDPESCKKAGLTVNEQTLNWWHSQPLNSRYEAVENPDRLPLKTALLKFSEWLRETPTTKRIWAKGTDFDCVILSNAYKAVNLPTPWKFWNVRDLRTLMDIAGVKNSDLPSGDMHHALQDCHRQIYAVSLCLHKLSR